MLLIIDFIIETEPSSLLFCFSFVLSYQSGKDLIYHCSWPSWLAQVCQSVSIAAAYIKEGKPAHGYLTLVVVVDTAPQYTFQIHFLYRYLHLMLFMCQG